MFKSKDHEAGFDRLYKDYQAFSSIITSDCTRLLDKAFENFEERCWDEALGCLEDGWLDEPHRMHRYENSENGGSLDGLFDLVEFYRWASKIPHYLYEAYEGFYEDEMARDLEKPMEEPENVREWIIDKIYGHTPRDHLRVYLEWNGILGWQSQIERILLDGLSG